MATDTYASTNREEIKAWAEERNAKPAKVKMAGAQNKGEGLLRLDFPGYTSGDLEDISWDEWFSIFEKHDLAFIYQKKTADGQRSNFNKIVDKKTAKDLEHKHL